MAQWFPRAIQAHPPPPLGTWLGSPVSENETHAHGELSTRPLPCAEARGCSKGAAPRRKAPPCCPLTQAMDRSPCGGSGQGVHSSRLAHLKHCYWEKTGRGERRRRAFRRKPGQNGETKTFPSTPTTNIWPHSNTLLLCAPTLAPHYQPKPIVSTGFHSWTCTFWGF